MAAADKGHVPSSVNMQASNANAALLQNQWSDYQKRFQPVADKVIAEMGSGPNTVFGQTNVAQAGELTDTAFNSALGAKQRDVARYGLGMSDQQKQAMNTEFDIAKSASKANAMNTANQTDIDLRNSVVSGGLGSVSATVAASS